MSPMPDPVDRLGASWTANAGAWTRVVREGAIPSRQAGTDAAIIEAVVRSLPPQGRVLDVGCGEGWLARALASLGAGVHGVDASAPLIEAAREEGGSFDVVTYAEAVSNPARLGEEYDAIVFNFALLDDDAVGILRAAASRLDVGGRVIVQTVHPASVGGTYSEGWREETFDAFGHDFEPMPWYFRTFGAWVRALDAAGLRLTEAVEPGHPETGAPLSLIMVSEAG